MIRAQLRMNSRTMKLHDWESVSISHLRFMRFFALVPLDGKTFNHIITKLLAIYAAIVNVLYHSPYTYYGIVKFTQKVRVHKVFFSTVIKNYN